MPEARVGGGAWNKVPGKCASILKGLRGEGCQEVSASSACLQTDIPAASAGGWMCI